MSRKQHQPSWEYYITAIDKNNSLQGYPSSTEVAHRSSMQQSISNSKPQVKSMSSRSVVKSIQKARLLRSPNIWYSLILCFATRSRCTHWLNVKGFGDPPWLLLEPTMRKEWIWHNLTLGLFWKLRKRDITNLWSRQNNEDLKKTVSIIEHVKQRSTET